MVPLDGDEDIGEVGRGFFGKATIPFGRVQQPRVQRPARIGRIETATTFIHHPMKATNRSASRRSKNSSVRRGQPVQASAQMPVIHPHAAGIDIGATSHWVCVPEDAVAEDQSSVREFGAFTKDLETGHPLGLGSTSKKVFVPNGSLYRAYTLLPRIRSARHYSNLCFRLLISDADRRAIACAEAIRSVTHLVLAPDPKKLSGSFFSYSQSFFVFSLSFLRLTGAPIPPQRDQKTFSAGPRSFSL